ncbi:MAG TPA: tetratricopeptide repeat protein [Terriglobia bacterium]|nr:tetratricopeptide repeat protein [Terriglobia bacterium]
MTLLPSPWKSLGLAVGVFLALLPSLVIPALPQSAPKPSASLAASPEDKTFSKIEALVRSKDYSRAESLLEASMPNSPSPAQAYFRMGKLYFDHDEWARAEHYLEKSLEAREGNDQAHLLLGLVHRELRQPERAEQEFMKAASLNPRSDVNAYFAGQQLLLDMKFEAALAYFYQAVNLNPRNASAYRALGMTQVHLGNYGLAESYYRKAIEALGNSSPADPGPFLDLAFILLLGHDPAKVEEALKLAQRGAALQPDSGDAHYLVGKALMKMGRVKESVPELELAAHRNPEDSKAHFQLALAYDALGEKEKARAERQALAKTKQRANQQGMASGSVMPQAVP